MSDEDIGMDHQLQCRAQDTIDQKRDLASFLEYFSASSAQLNFNFLSIVYVIMSLICMGLWEAEKKYNVQEVEGYFIVLLPFLPCALWALSMRLIGIGKQLVDPNHPNWKANQEKLEKKKNDELKKHK
jgi:hypothetical protein